jgi:hypothetical protein
MTWPRSRTVTDAERFEALLGSVEDLSTRVQALAGQVQLVNEFLRQDLDAHAIRAFDTASQALAEARDLDAKAVTLEELGRRERERAEKERKARRKRNWRLAAVAVVVVLAFVVLSVIVHHDRVTNNRLDRGLDAFSATAYDACQGRNIKNQQQRQLHAQLLMAEMQEQNAEGPSPAHQARIAAYGAALDAVPAPEDCSIYQRLHAVGE